jgi:hypothetical protein
MSEQGTEDAPEETDGASMVEASMVEASMVESPGDATDATDATDTTGGSDW